MGTLDEGRSGEEKARAYLEAKGYGLLAANFRTRMGELDLVMRDKDTVVFVEVKARNNDAFGRGEEAVTALKQRKIVRAALQYVKARRLHNSFFRFDVVSVGPGGKIEHLENAFGVDHGNYTF